MTTRIDSFNFRAGRKLGQHYVIEDRLGGGSEGEVYRIREAGTGIVRAAKFYFPHRDPKQRLSIRHAQKLNALRHCDIVLQYHHSQTLTVRGQKVLALISDLCDGLQLERFIARHRGGRLTPFRALHVLYHLVRGLEAVHAVGEYHADVHSQNILIHPRGVRFDLKLIDFYDWGRPARYKQQQDIRDAVYIFYECLGGQRHYANLPDEIRHICAGLKRSLLLQRFPTMTALRQHLETFEWTRII